MVENMEKFTNEEARKLVDNMEKSTNEESRKLTNPTNLNVAMASSKINFGRVEVHLNDTLKKNWDFPIIKSIVEEHLLVRQTISEYITANSNVL